MSLNDNLTAHADALRQKTGVTGKLSLTDMTKLMQYLTLGKLNLLKGTSNQYQATKSTTSNGYIDCAYYHNSYWLAYGATIKNTSSKPVKLKYILADNNRAPLTQQVMDDIPIQGYSNSTVNPGEEADISVIFKMDANTWFVLVSVVDADGSALSTDVQVKNERAYQSNDVGIWTPNPADKVGGISKSNLLPSQLNTNGWNIKGQIVKDSEGVNC